MPSQSSGSPNRFQYICPPKSSDVLLYTDAAEWGQGVRKWVFLCDCQSVFLYVETPALTRLPDYHCLSSTS